MKRSTKVFSLAFILLTVASFSVCHFGVNYEINKIPPETRAGMSDFDWVGVQWITLGMFSFIVGISIIFGAFVYLKIKQRKVI